MKKRNSVIALAVGSVFASFSPALAVTSLYGFDFNTKANEINDSGDKSYQENGYTFEPFNGNNASHCYDNGTGLGCFLETKNGDPTVLTEDSDKAFDGVAFYFDMQGNKNESKLNYFDVFDDGGDIFRFTVGEIYDGTDGVSVYYAKGANAFSAAGAITADLGYFAVFSNQFNINVNRTGFKAAGSVGSFDNILAWSWEGSETAQTRIDCVTISVSANGSNITDPANELAGSCTSTLPPVVPLPAGAILMLTAIGGLGFARRRKA